MTRNTLEDLNNHLFEQLERLTDEDLESDKLQNEINRSKAVSSIAKTIIDNGNLVLGVMQFTDDKMNADSKLPKMLKGSKDDIHE